jgi:hypothetical protein
MDSNMLAACAAVGGSLIGGMATLTSNNLMQQRHVRHERLLREQDRRETLYVEFVALAADRYIDSLDHRIDNPAALVALFSLIGKIRLFSSEPVLASAEAVGRHLIECYERPPIDAQTAVAERESMLRPVSAFTSACRRERDAVLRRL